MGKKWSIQGSCLYCGTCYIEFSHSPEFSFNFHKDGRQLPISVTPENISVENHTISIEKKIKVVEHLFSALYGLNIFNIRIDIYGEELPFFDGSSRNFVELLKDFPIDKDVGLIKIKKKIFVQEKDTYILFEPDETGLFIEMELTHPYIGKQNIALPITLENYIKEIASARTFVFTDESDPRLKNLPPYGIGITENKIYGAEPLRFSNEPVRHKVLDLLGDLYVLRKKLLGRIKAKNTSHRLNLKFVRKIASFV